MQAKTKGLVLQTQPIGEYDKRLVILTKEYGKITAFAKGAKKPKSKLLAGSEIFSYGEYILYFGKNSISVNQVDVIDSFYYLRNSIDKLAYGLYILEFIEHISYENTQNIDLMKLVLKTLKIIEKKELNYELIARIFELKALSFIGLTPWVHNCVKCHKDSDISYFSAKQGGIICLNCSNDSSNIKISSGTSYALKYVLNSPIATVFNFTLTKELLVEFSSVISTFVDYNIDKKFKALSFLNTSFIQ